MHPQLKNGCETVCWYTAGSRQLSSAMKYSRKFGITAFLAVTVSCLILVSAADGDQSVYFSLVVSSAPTLDTSQVVSSVDRAVQLINSDVTVLPGYNLQYPQVLDSQVINRLKNFQYYYDACHFHINFPAAT